jgi:hypothetical protein
MRKFGLTTLILWSDHFRMIPPKSRTQVRADSTQPGLVLQEAPIGATAPGRRRNVIENKQETAS